MSDSLLPRGLYQGYWSVLPFPSPGNLPNPGAEPGQLLYHLRHQGEWKCPSNVLTSSDKVNMHWWSLSGGRQSRASHSHWNINSSCCGCLPNIPFLIIAELLDPKEAAGWIEFESQNLNTENPEEFYVISFKIRLIPQKVKNRIFNFNSQMNWKQGLKQIITHQHS